MHQPTARQLYILALVAAVAIARTIVARIRELRAIEMIAYPRPS